MNSCQSVRRISDDRADTGSGRVTWKVCGGCNVAADHVETGLPQSSDHLAGATSRFPDHAVVSGRCGTSASLAQPKRDPHNDNAAPSAHVDPLRFKEWQERVDDILHSLTKSPCQS
jgi:hypothetical protein